MNKIVLILIVLLIGCNNKRDKNSDGHVPNILYIDSLTQGNRYLSLIDKTTYIPLETNDSCLLGTVTKTLYDNNRFYILDNITAKALFVFTKNGKFIFKISHLGRGPGEFIRPSDFDIDSIGNIYILDMSSHKIIKYSDNGKYLKDYKLKIMFDEFNVINDNEIFFKNAFQKGKCTIELGKYNLKNSKIETIFPASPLDAYDLPRFSFHYFFRSRNTTFFSPRFRNTIYKFSKDAKIIEFLKVEPINLPTNEFVMNLKKKSYIPNQNENCFIELRDIYETSEIFLLTIQDKFSRKILLSKKTGQGFIIYGFNDKNYLGDNSIRGIANEEFISYLRMDKWKGKNWIETINNSTIEDSEKLKLYSLSSNSNPIILLLKFKEF